MAFKEKELEVLNSATEVEKKCKKEDILEKIKLHRKANLEAQRQSTDLRMVGKMWMRDGIRVRGHRGQQKGDGEKGVVTSAYILILLLKIIHQVREATVIIALLFSLLEYI